MRHVILTALATAIAGSAMGADLAVTAPPPVLVYNWTGIYGGVNGGGAWGQQDPFNILTNRFDHDIGALLDDFSPEECQRYLVNAGYGST